MKTYAIHSVFHTLQGEGVHAGTAAVFVRFAGCNVWSGRPEDRERDSARGLCAAWCDTEFRLGAEDALGRLTAVQVVEAIVASVITRETVAAVDYIASGRFAEWPTIVVCTGGEPGLQLDDDLVGHLQVAGFRVHVETNGSRELPDAVDWVTLSPKPPMPVDVVQPFHEIKVVWPGVDPASWRWLADAQDGECPVWIQPRDEDDGIEAQRIRWAAAVEFVKANPWARLSLQVHKLLGIE